MKVKKVPMRTCVITHEKLEKKDLLRVVRNNEGKVFVDETGRANGRGAYVKKDKNVIEKARASKALEKHLEVKIEDSVYDELISKL
ncbi:MAG: YlxR family protein [Bacilli bacterium]|nr:YlxR family protein [Bacilli bacterium]